MHSVLLLIHMDILHHTAVNLLDAVELILKRLRNLIAFLVVYTYLSDCHIRAGLQLFHILMPMSEIFFAAGVFSLTQAL